MAQREIELSKNDINAIGSKELAYLGDSVYEVYIRKNLILKGIRGVKELNICSENYVSASAQANLFNFLSDKLTKEEMDVALRGRNTKLKSKSKSVSIGEYRKATGLECVFGYLYLLSQDERMEQLVNYIFEYINVEVM